MDYEQPYGWKVHITSTETYYFHIILVLVHQPIQNEVTSNVHEYQYHDYSACTSETEISS